MSVSLYTFSSCIGMRNLLVTPSIDDREGIKGGGEGTSANKENGGRYWFYAAAMTVDGGVAIGF